MYLYFGDDDMDRAAAYLCGIMTYNQMPFERVNSCESPHDDLLQQPWDVLILSDYKRERFRPGQIEIICEAVKKGAGLVMFGGWESYHGLAGEYHETALADVLPVTMLPSDDRRNFSQGVLLSPVAKKQTHPILDHLPWETPPFVGGLNEFVAKPDADVLLNGLPLVIRAVNGDVHFDVMEKNYPMLVVGQYGKGRTVALATDVAPHWVGGFVDWGNERVTQKLFDKSGKEVGFVEIGAHYAKFFAQLLQWAGRQL